MQSKNTRIQRQTRRHRSTQNRSGAIIPMFAILLPILFLFAAMAINLANVQLAQTELDIATDASARAASRTFSTTGKFSDAFKAAKEAAALNHVAGEPLKISRDDLELGTSQRLSVDQRYDFVPQRKQANAVRFTGRRNNGSTQGPIPTFLPSLLGQDSMSISSQSISTRVEVDIALVFDRSGSMAYADDEPAVYPPIPAAAPAGWDFGDRTPPESRWLDAVDAAKVFLRTVDKSPQNEFVSLTTYSDSASSDILLTDKYADFLNALSVHTREMKGGGTNIADGISKGLDSLHASSGGRSFCAKVIVVMTDGQKTVGGNPVDVARQAAKEGIAVYTVTFSQEADQNLMKEVAKEGQGEHFHAESRKDLIEVFRTIAAQLPTLLVE